MTSLCLHLAIVVCIYSMLALSVDLLTGHTGLVSLASAAFCGVGAYASAIVAVRLGVSFCTAMLVAVSVSSILAAAIALPAVRFVDDYFVLITLAVQVIINGMMSNWASLTQGPLGIAGVPTPVIGGVRIDTAPRFLLLSLLFLLVAQAIVSRLVSGPFGRVLHAIREDEVIASAMGKNVICFKVLAFTVSAGIAGAAGGLFAFYFSYIDPGSFGINDAILVLSMVIIGGAGSRWGPIFGAGILVILPEGLRMVGFSGSVAANLRQISYGLMVVLLMMFRPRGLVGRFAFGRRTWSLRNRRVRQAAEVGGRGTRGELIPRPRIGDGGP